MDLFWERDNWELEDKHLKALQQAPFRREFPRLNFVPGLHIVRGPRQVGKSSFLKTLLRDLGKHGPSFYLSCETIADYKELSALLKTLRNERRLILLDEVTFVSEWARAVKHEIDSGFSGMMVVTGSNSSDLRRGGDTMPGRIAGGQEILILPMGLSEYAEMRTQANWPKLTHEALAQAFFRTGGFPSAVIEGGPEARAPEMAREVYRRWLSGDTTRLGRSEAFLREFLLQIARTMTTPISLQKLAQRTSAGSHHTAGDYVALLEDSFAIRTCYAIDPETQGFKFRSEKKFYFTDPLLYALALEWGGQQLPTDWEALVAEMTAHEELFRYCQTRRQRFGYHRTVRGEIDFLCPDRWQIEVKWSAAAHNLSRVFLDSLVPNKIVWTKGNFLKEWPD